MLTETGVIGAVELELRTNPPHPAQEAVPDAVHSAADDAAFDRALHRHTAYEALAGSYHPAHHNPQTEAKGS